MLSDISQSRQGVRHACRLIVPGLFGSGPGHWQDHWLKDDPCAIAVIQDNWSHPISTLDRPSCRRSDGPSRRDPRRPQPRRAHHCPACPHRSQALWAGGSGGPRRSGECPRQPSRPGDGRGARPNITSASRSGRRQPQRSLSTLYEAVRLAAVWGARLVDLGQAGHVNIASGHGRWAAGHDLAAAVEGRGLAELRRAG